MWGADERSLYQRNHDAPLMATKNGALHDDHIRNAVAVLAWVEMTVIRVRKRPVLSVFFGSSGKGRAERRLAGCAHHSREPLHMPTIFRAGTFAMVLRATLTAGAVLASPLPIAAVASDEILRHFTVPAGPLDDALSRFARQAGVTVSFDSTQVSGRQTRGVQGEFGLGAALDRLLAGTGLAARAEAEGYVLVAAPEATGATMLPAVRVEGATEHVRSTTEGNRSYAPSTVSIGKGQQSLKDVPQSVTVISRQRMDDQNLRSIDDVMDQATGVSRTTNGFYGSAYTARGLDVSKVRYDGGAARKQVIYWYQRNGDDDMAAFDHVEVLRGADGLFAGAGEAGGVINLSYKRPTSELQVHGEMSSGSWSNYRVEADVSGPLALQGRVRGRLVGALQDRDFFYDHASRRTTVLYGALELDLGPDTLLFAGIDHQRADEDGTSWGHLRYLDGSLVRTSRSTNYATPWSYADSDRSISFVQLEHQWNADWKGQLRLEHYDGGTDFHAGRLGGPIYPENPQGSYWGGTWDGDISALTADLSVKGGFDWLGRRHDVTLGADWVRSEADYLFSNPDFGEYTWSGLDPIVVPPRPEKHPGGPMEYVAYEGTERGVYGAIHLRPIEAWTLIAGGRYVVKDKTDASSIWLGELSRTVTDQDDVFIPYYGVVYALNERTNAYASATEIYTSQATRLGAPLPGTPLDPVRGSNYELGLKHELSSTLAASAALYRIEKKGMGVRDPAYPNTPGERGSSCCYYRDGYQISEGLDLEINGELLPGWEASVGYTYNRNENRRENDTQFNTLTPRHLLKLWTQYRFRHVWDGLSVGTGVVAQSNSRRVGEEWPRNPDTGEWEGPLPYRISQAGYAVWSARAEYELSSKISVAVNANNLFDKHYLSSLGYLGNGNYWGEPRNLMLTLRGRW